MTKARDLAGFASSSVTTTASDGLVLKGDGSSTDVVIKNGANATVASVADGTVNIAAAGSITATGASVGALARGSIQVGNSSGVAAALAKGTSGYVLTAGANDLSWAEVQVLILLCHLFRIGLVQITHTHLLAHGAKAVWLTVRLYGFTF